MREKLMQDIIIKYPSEVLDEEGMIFVDREVTTGNRRLDVVFKDRMGRFVLLEVQKGHLDTHHIDRHIDFCMGFKKKFSDANIRIMYVANFINILQKEFLHSRGYEFKELSESKLLEIANKYRMTDEDQKELSMETNLKTGVTKETEEKGKPFIVKKDITHRKGTRLAAIDLCLQQGMTKEEILKYLNDNGYNNRSTLHDCDLWMSVQAHMRDLKNNHGVTVIKNPETKKYISFVSGNQNKVIIKQKENPNNSFQLPKFKGKFEQSFINSDKKIQDMFLNLVKRFSQYPITHKTTDKPDYRLVKKYIFCEFVLHRKWLQINLRVNKHHLSSELLILGPTYKYKTSSKWVTLRINDESKLEEAANLIDSVFKFSD